MTNEIINSMFFGLGIMGQVIFLIGYRFNEENIKKIKKDIRWGLFFMFFMFFLASKSLDQPSIKTIILAIVCGFYFGFSTSFALSFKEKILLYINEIMLFVLNIIFFYYCIVYLGAFGIIFIAFDISIFFLISLVLFLKKNINIKGYLYIWYILLFASISIFNIYYTWNTAENNLYLSYLSSFLTGGIFLYIFIYFIYIVIFIPVTDERSSYAIRNKNLEIANHFSQLSGLFYKTKISNFKVLTLFVVLIGFLIINYYNNYISESLLIVFILFIASVSSAKRIDLTKKDVTKKE